MSTDNGYAGGSSGRVTMKDVYDIVGGLDKKFDLFKDHVQTVTVDHERRLTEQRALADAGSARLDKVEQKVGELRDEHNVARGHVKALSWIAGGLATAFCGFGAVGLAHALHW